MEPPAPTSSRTALLYHSARRSITAPAPLLRPCLLASISIIRASPPCLRVSVTVPLPRERLFSCLLCYSSSIFGKFASLVWATSFLSLTYFSFYWFRLFLAGPLTRTRSRIAASCWRNSSITASRRSLITFSTAHCQTRFVSLSPDWSKYHIIQLLNLPHTTPTKPKPREIP